jgi:hypothetical protein
VVVEGPGADQPIERVPAGITAFVGRTLRGPVGKPVRVGSIAEYQQVFGGLWQPSTLSYAVEQYFDNGGRCAIIVRVVNGARPATISLPCGRETLTLEALSPGTREILRASVDYDNISAVEMDRFNLVVQRVRTAGTEHIEDQEIFRRLSTVPGTRRFVSAALMESMLVRVRGGVPQPRPEATFRPGSRHPIGYVLSNPDGDDGGPLSDYDLIGSPEKGSGLFALREAADFDFLCIPPVTRDTDVGASVLVVAERVCRERGAILVVDPPVGWSSCEDAVVGLRELGLQSENALMCFPRVIAFDRLRGRHETFAACGAVAGTLARMDAQRHPIEKGPDEELLLRPVTRPTTTLSQQERNRLAAHGINPLVSVRGSAQVAPLRTLAKGAQGGIDASLLANRRRLLSIVRSIEHGTRWATFGAGDRAVWRRITKQVEAFLEPIFDGAFHVVCDERVNTRDDIDAGKVNLLVGLGGMRAGELHSFLIVHGAAGSTIRTVRSNWLPPGFRLSVGAGDREEIGDDTQRRLALSLSKQPARLAPQLYPVEPTRKPD